MIADSDKVTSRFTARGEHKGEFMGLPPTGKPIVMTGIEIFRLENGKIATLGRGEPDGTDAASWYFTQLRISEICQEKGGIDIPIVLSQKQSVWYTHSF